MQACIFRRRQSGQTSSVSKKKKIYRQNRKKRWEAEVDGMQALISYTVLYFAQCTVLLPPVLIDQSIKLCT